MADIGLNQASEGLELREALLLDDGHIRLREQQLRENVADEIFSIFKRANTVTFLLVGVLCIVDIVCLAIPVAEYRRLITSEVVMTLIGATVVQAGAAAFAIAVSLFPKSSNS